MKLLRHSSSDGHDSRVIITRASSTIGRGAENDITIPVLGVSRRHAVLEQRGREFILRDAGSKNGLLVDGRKQTEIAMAEGVRVQIGGATVWIEDALSEELRIARSVIPATGRRKREEPETEEMGGWRAAFRLLARLAATRRVTQTLRLELMSELRDAIEASAVILADLARSEPWFVAIVGNDRHCAVARSIGTERRSTFRVPGASVRARRAGARVLYACFDGSPHKTDDWQELCFDTVAGRLLNDVEVPPPGRGYAPRQIPSWIVAESDAMRGLLRDLGSVAATNDPVLLLGEIGTGKSLLARLVHEWSGRRGEFVYVNAANFTAGLVESQLFGIEQRVATDVDARRGLLQQAAGGTIFFDEIGEMTSSAQAQLLHLLDNVEVRSVGGRKLENLNVRVVAATHSGHAVRDDIRSRFGAPFVVPPLRDRLADLPMIVSGVIAEVARSEVMVTERALEQLAKQNWPGNVRDLKLAVKAAMRRTGYAGVLDQAFDRNPEEASSASLNDDVGAVTRKRLEAALVAHRGNKAKVARALGISRNHVYALIKRLKTPTR